MAKVKHLLTGLVGLNMDPSKVIIKMYMINFIFAINIKQSNSLRELVSVCFIFIRKIAMLCVIGRIHTNWEHIS
jgi:hypothetical protein